MDVAGMLAGAGVLVGGGSMVGVRAFWGDREGVGLASSEGVGVECLLLWTEASEVIWHAESSKHIQINAIINVR
jgi:hypothetical protein